ncbi:hypothetical protein F4820DRAFT_425769 [Hypoxylon rubiginosum]|uniref:Uncharacterized protein n=1 Tax=Hypoxylon rubiginosum TaxID=110542 RepID=A0ACB9YX42_9PEZI|nr:hypothetical protein F4820DRAFT_425769 [Hypoxylon rubiginosum]
MSRPFAFELPRDAPLVLDEAERELSPLTGTFSLRRLLSRLWSKLNIPFISKLKSRWRSSKRKDTTEAMATQQGIAATSITIPLETIYHNGATSSDQASSRGQLTDSTVGYNHDHRHYPGQNGEYFPTIPYHQNSSKTELNDSGDNSDLAADSSSNSIAFKRRGLRLDIKIPESDMSNGGPSTNAASSTTVPDTSSSIEPSNAVDEREKTLRMLESGSRSSTHRSASPATLRRHRRSYQLATDPRIDPQQYSDFLDFLEHEVSMDVSLRVRIWKSLIKDSENREGSVTQLESQETGSRSELLSQYYCPLLPKSSGSGSDLPGPSVKRRAGSWIWQPNNRKVRFQDDDQLSPLERKLRNRQSCPTGHHSIDHTLHTDPQGNGALRRSNAMKRHSSSDASMPRETSASADKRRRVSASSLAHSFTQYIKPEVPATINREPRTPGPSDRHETTSQTSAVPESGKE